MSEMEQARIKSTNLDSLNKLTKLDLLVIDDFGLMDLDLDKYQGWKEINCSYLTISSQYMVRYVCR